MAFIRIGGGGQPPDGVTYFSFFYLIISTLISYRSLCLIFHTDPHTHYFTQILVLTISNRSLYLLIISYRSLYLLNISYRFIQILVFIISYRDPRTYYFIEILVLISLCTDSHVLTISCTDPRTKDWLLLYSTPVYMLTLTAAYLLFVWLGPKFMRNRAPFSLQYIMVVYNISLVGLSVYMLVEVIYRIWIVCVCF